MAPVTWGWHRGLCSALPALPGCRRALQGWVGQASTATIWSRAQSLWVPQGPCHLSGLVHLLSGLPPPRPTQDSSAPDPAGEQP